MSRATCPYIFTKKTKKAEKGDPCGVKIKGKTHYCSRHMKSKQAIDFLAKDVIEPQSKDDHINESIDRVAGEIQDDICGTIEKTIGNKRKREEPKKTKKEPVRKRAKLDNDVVTEYQKEYNNNANKERPSYLSKLDKRLQANEVTTNLLNKTVEFSDEDDDSDDENMYSDDDGYESPELPEISTTPQLPTMTKLREMSRKMNTRSQSIPEPMNDPMQYLNSMGIGNGNQLLTAFGEPLLMMGVGLVEKSSDSMKGFAKNVKDNPMLLTAYNNMLREKAPDFLLNISDTKLFLICMTVSFTQTYMQNKFSN